MKRFARDMAGSLALMTSFWLGYECGNSHWRTRIDNMIRMQKSLIQVGDQIVSDYAKFRLIQDEWNVEKERKIREIDELRKKLEKMTRGPGSF